MKRTVAAVTAVTIAGWGLIAAAGPAQASRPLSYVGSLVTENSPDEPGRLAVSPDGAHVWAPSYTGGSSMIDSFTGTTTPVVERHSIAPTTDPWEVAFTPDSTAAFVTSTSGDVVVRMAAGDGSVTTRIPVGTSPHGIAVGATAAGVRAYVANTGSDDVSVIDVATDSLVETISSVGSAPQVVALTPDGGTAYVGVSGGIAVIDTATNTVSSTVGLSNGSGHLVRDVVVAPDGSQFFVSHDDNSAGMYSEGRVSAFSTDTLTRMATSASADGSPQPFTQLTVTPDGRTLYGASGGQTSSAMLYTYDTADFVDPLVDVSHVDAMQAQNTDAWGIAASPAANLVYVTERWFPNYSMWASFDVYSTPVAPPGAPRNPTATPASGRATVTWTAPASDGGSPITGYTVTASPGGATCTTATLSCDVAGLTDGTSYTFSVQAENAQGSGPVSVASTAVTPAPAVAPSAPRSPAATAGHTAATVTWTAPASTGGSPITGYTVTASPGGATCTATTLSCSVTGLTDGTAYTFTVTATNAAGTGAASTATSAVTPQPEAPSAPRSPAATAGNAQATVTWTAPADDGGSAVTGYIVTASPGNATCTSGTLTCTLTGLSNGTAYTFTVVASNAVGNGPASSATTAVTPLATPPGAPQSLVAVSGNGAAVVSWTAPASDGGSPVTGYTVTAAPGGATCTTATLSCIVPGLANGTSYTVTVTATNARGTGPASNASAPVVPQSTAPGAPTGVAGAAGVSSIEVSWTAPTSGLRVDHYLVTASPGAATCSTTGTSCVLGGVAGVSYTISVRAVTAQGVVGPVGTATTGAVLPPVVLDTVPDAPLTLTTDQGQVSTVVAGQALTVIGTGFAPFSTATIAIYSTPVVLGTVVTDADGDFAKPVIVPTDLEPGSHDLVAYGVSPTGDLHSMRMTVQVNAAQVDPAQPGHPGRPAVPDEERSGALAVTGADLLVPTVLAAVLLVVGGLLMAAVRRRRVPREDVLA